MATTVSAASFIAAVLEQAGYLSQERFLDVFTQEGFFSEAGALIYVLGGIGGVISLIMFGSFRAARYLLIGPALFWFLTQPRVDYDGVIWQIGGGIPRGLNQKTGEGVAREDRDFVITNSGTGAPHTIRVAAGFALFARPINGITQAFISWLLRGDTDRYYKMVWGKGRALELLLNLRSDDGIFHEMLDSDFVRQCSDMYGWALARSAFDLRDNIIALVPDRSTPQRRRSYYEQRFNQYRSNRFINPGTRTREYLTAAGATGQLDRISCQEMWTTVAAYITDIALERARRILELARGEGADEDLACREIMRKIVEDNGNAPTCQLERAAALFLLKNHFTDRRSTGRFVSRIMDTVSEPRSIESRTLLTMVSNPTAGDLSEAEALVGRVVTNGQGLSGLPARDQVLFYLGMGERRARELNDDQSRNRVRNEFRSQARLTAIGGPLDAGLSEYPRYHLKNLRQQMFTFSLNLPYYQGVLLYVLSMSYPFVCLIVLLPGRAAGFLNLPLAWLWVKSWDIGIACVMILERVLWNVLPSLDIPRTALDTPLPRQQLWQALSETQKFDNTWNLHIYYMVLAMVTLSIPAITGYATLRSRRAILTSFTQKLIEDSKDAGQRAAGMHGVRVMAERVRMMSELQGLANRIVRAPGEGMRAQGRDQSAQYFARVAAMSHLATAAPTLFAQVSTNPAKFAEAIKANAQAKAIYVRTYAEILTLEAKADAARMAAFDPLIGRYGKLAMMNESYAAAMDGYGGYELNRHELNGVAEFGELHRRKVNIMLNASASLTFLEAAQGMVQPMPPGAKGPPDPNNKVPTIAGLQGFNDIFFGAPPTIGPGFSHSDYVANHMARVSEIFGIRGFDHNDPNFRRRVLGLTPDTDQAFANFLALGEPRRNGPTTFVPDMDLARARYAERYELRLDNAADPRYIPPSLALPPDRATFQNPTIFRARGWGILDGTQNLDPAPGPGPGPGPGPISLLTPDTGLRPGDVLPRGGGAALNDPRTMVASRIGAALPDNFSDMRPVGLQLGERVAGHSVQQTRWEAADKKRQELAALNVEWLFEDRQPKDAQTDLSRPRGPGPRIA